MQTIPLYTGWNLISFQVNEAGFTPQEIVQALGPDTNALMAIWGYDAKTATWEVWKPANPLPPDLAKPGLAPLPRLYPGNGYWVKVSKGVTLQVTGVPWSGSTTLVPGWNLVGFPGLTIGVAGQSDFQSVFRDQLSSVPIIWTFEGGTLQEYSGYDALAYPPITTLTGIQPGAGYWVYSLGNVTLTPNPQIALAPDSDASPLQTEELFTTNSLSQYTNDAVYLNQIVRFAGPEDAAFDLNHNGILDNPYTQDTIFFKAGLNQQNFTIANSGYGRVRTLVAILV